MSRRVKLAVALVSPMLALSLLNRDAWAGIWPMLPTLLAFVVSTALVGLATALLASRRERANA